MRWVFIGCFLASACGGDFQIPPRADMRVSIDFSGSLPGATDAGCFNTVCGGCSSWRNWNGTPAKVGDPCLFHGVYECRGTSLICNDMSCPSCAQVMQGTVCGADGHTVYVIAHTGPICSVIDTGAATGICAQDANDKCLGRCTLQGNTYQCSAGCAGTAPPDGGVTLGCGYDATASCTTLAGC